MEVCSTERKDVYSVNKRNGDRRRLMTITFRSCFELTRVEYLSGVTYRQFRHGITILNRISLNLFTPVSLNNAQLLCELCYAWNSVLKSVQINQKDFEKFLERILSDFRMDDFLSVPKIIDAHQRLKETDPEKANNLTGYLTVSRKMKRIYRYLKNKIGVNDYNIVTLQKHEKKKKVSYHHTSKMNKSLVIAYILQLLVGTSSTKVAGQRKAGFNNHCVFVSGYYRGGDKWNRSISCLGLVYWRFSQTNLSLL